MSMQPSFDPPLAGVRVLDIATFIAAPYCASILSEFGAEVIKVEQPGTGDPFRGFGTASKRADSTLCWLSEARNRRSITLNLREPEGQDTPQQENDFPINRFVRLFEADGTAQHHADCTDQRCNKDRYNLEGRQDHNPDNDPQGDQCPVSTHMEIGQLVGDNKILRFQ